MIKVIAWAYKEMGKIINLNVKMMALYYSKGAVIGTVPSVTENFTDPPFLSLTKTELFKVVTNYLKSTMHLEKLAGLTILSLPSMTWYLHQSKIA